MPEVYFIDFETRSSTPIENGIRNYLTSPHSDIVCLAWKKNIDGKTNIWLPRTDRRLSEPPFIPTPSDKFYAFNAQFDFLVWNVLGQRYHFRPLSLNQMVDVMALCGRYTIPQSLDRAGEALNVPIRKDRKGKALIKKICTPPFKYTQADMVDFLSYCVTDVNSMVDIVHKLPFTALDSKENEYWKLTVKMNNEGVPIDTLSCDVIYKTLEQYMERCREDLRVLTDGKITAPTQVKRIKDYVNAMGCDIPSLAAGTIKEYLPLITDEKILKVLKIRQQFSKTSNAKYKKFIELSYNGRIYENLRYYGAATGRWAGMGAQLHNLPRGGGVDIEPTIDKFYDRSIMKEDPVEAAKNLIRPMIKAKGDSRLVVVDYSSIENRVLMWLCMETEALKLLRDGQDQYKDMASYLYNTGYNQVTKEQRAVGKTLILGAGYGLGAIGFKEYVKGFDIDMADSEADRAIKAYRKKYRNVSKYWYEAKDAMIYAIINEKKIFTHGRCKYTTHVDHTNMKWLVLGLPSGRTLWYRDPLVKDDRYGALPSAMGIDSRNYKWTRLKIIPGRIVENIVQALSRDILAEAKLKLNNMNYKVILSVHDEIIVETHKDTAELALKNMVKIMSTPPEWAVDLPLSAEGFITQRYRK